MSDVGVEVWTSYAGSESSVLLDEVEDKLGNKVSLKRYMRVTEADRYGVSAQQNDDPGAPVESKDTPPQKERGVWYYKKPRSSLFTLAQEIGYSAWPIIFLSSSYFRSRWCLSELMCAATANRRPLIVHHSDNGYLKIWQGIERLSLSFPGVALEPDLTLAQVLAALSQHHDPVHAKSPCFFEKWFSGLSEDVFSGPNVDSIAEAVEGFATSGYFLDGQFDSVTRFKHWCASGVASSFVEGFNLDSLADELVGVDVPAEGELPPQLSSVFLRTAGTGRDVPIEEHLRTFLASQSTHYSELELLHFVQELCGFAAFPVVRQAWLATRDLMPGIQFIYTTEAGDEGLLQASLGRATLYGGGIRLSLKDVKNQIIEPVGPPSILTKPALGASITPYCVTCCNGVLPVPAFFN